jgi:hypothetical protein
MTSFLRRRRISLNAERHSRDESDKQREGSANHSDPPEAVRYRIQQPFAMLSSENLRVVREGIYAAVVETGTAPPADALARTTNLTVSLVEDAYRALADAHVIVLQPGTTAIRWPPPFSAVPTPFRVTAGESSWFSPCAWDSFGILAALKRDGVVHASCAHSREPVPCGVESGRSFGEGIIHLLVPAARFWDDIIYT